MLLLFFFLLYISFILQKDNIIFNQIENEYEKNDKSPFSSRIPVAPEWYRTWGGYDFHDYGESVAIDSVDNIYLGGTTDSFGVRVQDLCLIKYDNLGAQLWNRTWGTNDYDSGKGVVVDSSDNVYLAGYTFDDDARDGEMVLVKYNSMGVLQWDRIWGGGDDIDHCYAIAIDSFDNIYLAGETQSIGAGCTDMCLVKYDSSGSRKWVRTWGGSGCDNCKAIAVDSSDNIYLAGTYGGNICLVKYNNSGYFEWYRTWGGSGDDHGYAVAIDSSDSIYLGGTEDDRTPFFTNYNMGLIKYNSSGVEQWSRIWDGGGNEGCYSITFDSLENIYIVGYTDSYGVGGNDMCLVKYDRLGVQQWNFTWGGNKNDECFAIALDSIENIYLAGDTESYGAGGNDLCLVKIVNNPVPEIFINSPTSYQLFGTKAPNFNISMIDSDLNTTWYTLNGGSNHIFSGTIGTINHTAWKTCPNGTVSIKFYVNDSMGSESFAEILVLKDIEPPNITIISPTPNKLFGNGSINFELSFDEPNLDTTWYSLNNGLNYTFLGTSGIINQIAWESCEDGEILIRFYAYDTVGNRGYEEVTVIKNINYPYVTIISPRPNEFFGNSPPNFELSISEEILNQSWYSLNSGLNYTFLGISGIINQTAWNECEDGEILIRFYLNDSLGREVFNEVTIYKDFYAPEITVIAPNQHVIFRKPPKFSISIVEPNLKSIWYTLNEGVLNISCGLSGQIDQELWDALDVGNVYLKFYANDYAGYEAFQVVILIKEELNCTLDGNYWISETWNRMWGSQVYPEKIILDSSNNIYVTGNAGYDIFLIKFNNMGVVMWNKTWGGNGNEGAKGIAIDSSNNIYIVGVTFSFGSTSAGDICLIKYNNSGVQQWNRTIGGDINDYGEAIAIDWLDNIYITGFVTGFGAGGNDMCLIKYNTSGHQLWNRTWGGNAHDRGKSIAIDSEDNIYVGGEYNYEYGVSHFRIFLTKYNSSGEQMWTETYGSAFKDAKCSAIAIDSEDNIYLTGTSTLKYNSLGVGQWGQVSLSGDDIFIDSSDSIHILHGYMDAVIGKYNDSGFEEWNVVWGGSGNDVGMAIMGDFNGNIFLTLWKTYGESAVLVKFSPSPPLNPFIIINKGEEFTCSNLINITLSANSVDEMCFKNGSIGVWTSWESYNMTKLLYLENPINNTENIIYVKFRNVIGESEPVSDSIYYLVFPPLNPSIVINNGDISTGDNLVTLTLLADGADEVCFRNGTISTWTAWEPYSLTKQLYLDGSLNNTEYTIYAKFQNATGETNPVSDSIFFIVFLPLNPTISINNDDLSTNNTFVTLILSVDGADEMCFRNGTVDTWTSWEPFSMNKQLYLEGSNNNTEYIISVKFQNEVGESNPVYDSILFLIIIPPNNIPKITNNIDNFTVNIGTTDFSISWHVIDIDGNNHSYWIIRNQNKINGGFWDNDTNIVYIEMENLSAGLYNYTCFVNDTLGSINQSSIFVKINFYPYYSSIELPPINTYSPFTNYVFNCTWNDDDGSIQEVRFEFNYFNYTVTNNYLGEFSYTLIDLAAIGTGYNFKWHAMDGDGAWNSTELQTYILHKNITQLMILFNGTEENIFNCFDPFINTTIINLNSTPGTLNLIVNNELWQQEIGYTLINISQFPIGAYNITAVLLDENYTGNTMNWLIIQEKTPPEIFFEFSDFFLNTTKPEYFHSNLEVICAIYDLSPMTWVYICENSSGFFINRSMNSLGNGNWTYLIDISALSWNDMIIFSFYANDSWGNIGYDDNSSVFYKIKIFDFHKPLTTISFIPHSQVNIVNKSTLFTLIASDGMGSGISVIKYKINDSDWIIYNSSFDLSTHIYGDYLISFYAIDVIGNTEEIKTLLVTLVDIDIGIDGGDDEDDNGGDDENSGMTIPGYHLILLISIIGLISAILIKKKYKF